MEPTFITLLGVIGLILVALAIWLRNEVRQDILFISGGLLLLVYAISIGNPIFILLQIVFVASAFAELVNISTK